MPIQSKARDAIFEQAFRNDLQYWIGVDRRMALRVMRLVDAVMTDPFEGIGKPEPLRYERTNTWSRRIDDEHRLVYIVNDEEIYFVLARYHYA
jgi:toxin YoeB